MTKLVYQGPKDINVEPYPDYRLVTAHIFNANREGVLSSLDPDETREIVKILKEKVRGNRNQILIDLFKFPKIKAMVIEGGFPLTAEQVKEKNLDKDYLKVAELLDSYDRESEAVVTFVNPQLKNSVVTELVKF